MIQFNMPWEFGFPLRKSPQGKHFKDSWLSNKIYSDWIARGPRNTQARCRICKGNFELGNMGSSSLTSHGKGKSHEFKVKDSKKLADFFKPNQKTYLNLSFDVALKGLDTNAQSISGVQPTAQVTFEVGGKFCAEIRCALNMCWVVTAIIRARTLFAYLKACFLTVKLLKKMELGPNKLKYLVNHGLAPYFKECLSDDILKSEYFVVSW